MNKSVKVSCEMIVERDGKVLMGKRKNIFGANQWGFPGGHMEVGELTIDCAKRELKEETGIEATKIRLIAIINDVPEYQDEHYVRFVYLITDWGGEIINAEPECCYGWEWFAKDKLPEPLFVGHKKVVPVYLNKNGCVENVKVLDE